jgi:hypothetical protein
VVVCQEPGFRSVSGVQSAQRADPRHPEVHESRIVSANISGDFLFHPRDQLSDLERALAGIKVEDIEEAIPRFYEDHAIESPGVQPADLPEPSPDGDYALILDQIWTRFGPYSDKILKPSEC